MDNNENIIKNEAQSFLQKVKDTITLKGNNWTSIIYDYGQKKFGIPINAPMEYNQDLSDVVTNVFKNTKVNVYIYQSKKANIIGIPGANKNITPEMLRNEAAREAEIGQINNNFRTMAFINGLNQLGNKHIYLSSPSTITFKSGTIYESISNAIKNNNKEGGEIKLIYDPITQKLDINVEEVSVYVSSNYINCMEHDDEIVAAILCEIAKNTILFRKYIQDKALNISFAILFPIINIFSGILFAKNIADNSNDNSPMGVIKTLSPFILSTSSLLLVFIFIGIYLAKRRNIEYDEFVVKCGYGDALNRAIDNYNKFIFGNSTTQSDAMEALNWFDKIAHFINKIGMYIYNFISKFGITSNQSIQRRHNTIENKTNNYDYNLIDRSDRIL